MADPVVSICLPTYNYAQFLPRAVESVLGQTFADFELLVYDDASGDDTVAVMRPYLDDPRVKLVVQPQNQGLFANFNQSAEAARGELIKYLCADDFLDERFLELLVPLMEDPAVQIATCANWLIDGEDNLTGEQIAPFGAAGFVESEEVARQLAEWHNVVGMPTNTIVRRRTLAAVGGFDGRYAPAADIHLWLKLLAHGGLAWAPEKLCFIRIHSTHSHAYGPDPTESPFLVWRDATAIENSPATTAIARRGLQREAERVYLYVAAHLLRFRPSRARELLALPRGYVDRPRSLLRWLAGVPRQVVGEISRIRALRSGHMVVYDPRPHGGDPVGDVSEQIHALSKTRN